MNSVYLTARAFYIHRRWECSNCSSLYSGMSTVRISILTHAYDFEFEVYPGLHPFIPDRLHKMTQVMQSSPRFVFHAIGSGFFRRRRRFTIPMMRDKVRAT